MKSSIAVSFIFIVLGAVLYFLPTVNQSLFIAINSLLPNANVWIVITTLGDGAVAGCLFYLLFRKRNDLLAKGLIGALLGFLASQGLKKLFAVTRPEHTSGFDVNFHLLTESMATTNFSMPSGHTITAFLLGAFLFRYMVLNLAEKILLTLSLVAVAVSRIALGVHWPADVFVGAGLGILVAVVCGTFPINIKNKWGVLAVHVFYLPFFILSIYRYLL